MVSTKLVTRPGCDVRVRYQQHHVGIVMREAAMLGLLFGASGVNHADVRRHDDIGRPRIAAGPQIAAGAGNGGNAGRVKHGRERSAVKDLADSRRRGVALEDTHGR